MVEPPPETGACTFSQVRIILVFYQVLNTLPFVLPAVTFPQNYTAFLGRLSVVNLSILDALPSACMRPGINFYDTLFVSTIWPICFVLLGLMVFVVHRATVASERRTALASSYYGETPRPQHLCVCSLS